MKHIYPLYSKKSISYLTFHFLGLVAFGLQLWRSYEKGYYYPAVFSAFIISLIIISYVISIRKGAPFAPRLEVTDDHILYRPEVFGASNKILWENISSIRISKLTITILLKNGETEYFNFKEDRGIQKPMLAFIKHISEQNKVEVSF